MGPGLPMDFPILVTLRLFLEPLLLYGGGRALHLRLGCANYI